MHNGANTYIHTCIPASAINPAQRSRPLNATFCSGLFSRIIYRNEHTVCNANMLSPATLYFRKQTARNLTKFYVYFQNSHNLILALEHQKIKNKKYQVTHLFIVQINIRKTMQPFLHIILVKLNLGKLLLLTYLNNNKPK